MVSHYPDPPTFFHDTTFKIITDFLDPNGFEYYDADGGGGGGIWSNQDLKECIENNDPDYHGVGIINYFGHGDTAKWDEWNVSENFTTADVHGLSNTNLYPIVYNCCCWNGAIQAEQEAMVEAWIRNSDGGGVGALGASVMAWAAQFWGFNHIPVDLFRATFALGIYKVGWAINYAKDRLVEEEPAAYGFALHNARTYNWFGDPELSIWTCPAPCSTMNVSHPMNISIGQQNFTVTVINPVSGPVQYALVCLYKDENPELWQTQYTNSNGQASFRINPQYGGVLYVTVTKHNYAPYERECTVWPAGGGGPQSEESSPAIPKNYALNQNSPNPFCRTTFIPYQIPARGDKQFISIKIYDVDGRLIKILVNQQQEAGYYVKTWDGRDENNKKVSNGIYFLRFEATDYSETRKLLLIR